MLKVIVREKNAFYSLFAAGIPLDKTYDKNTGEVHLFYRDNSVLFLYYTYPNFREACVVRAPPAITGNHITANLVSLPSLSGKVSLLFSVRASKVDKLKRAASFLNTHSADAPAGGAPMGAYQFNDAFYARLYFIVSQRGKINYPALQYLIHSR